MLMLALLAALCGAVLAFRYKAPILFPVIVCALVTALCLGFVLGAGGWSLILGIIAVTLGVQLGFLFGKFARSMIAGSRAASKRRAAAERSSQTAPARVFPH